MYMFRDDTQAANSVVSLHYALTTTEQMLSLTNLPLV
jgi:hypothetical protein